MKKCPHCQSEVNETIMKREREDGAQEELTTKTCPEGCFNVSIILTVSANVAGRQHD